MDIIIRAARIIDSAGNTAARQQDILIRKGRIEKIADNIPNDKKLKEVTGSNLHVSIGWVDMCAYIGDPGLEHREDLQTAIRAAAAGAGAGGTTTGAGAGVAAVGVAAGAGAAGAITGGAVIGASLRITPLPNVEVGIQAYNLFNRYDLRGSGSIADGSVNPVVIGTGPALGRTLTASVKYSF